jgi:predicted transcriptional regulator
MNVTNRSLGKSIGLRRSESETGKQRRMNHEANAADAADPVAAEHRRQRTLRALTDVDAGRLIDDEVMQAWVESLGTDYEKPVPEPD